MMLKKMCIQEKRDMPGGSARARLKRIVRPLMQAALMTSDGVRRTLLRLRYADHEALLVVLAAISVDLSRY